MNNKIVNTLALTILVISSASFAETYTYTGPSYNTASSPYTTDMSVSGSFTTSSAIPPSSVDFDLRPIVTSWSFFDGLNTLTEANSEFWDLGGAFPPIASTDADGNITAAILLLHSPVMPHEVGDVIDRLQIRSDALSANALNDTVCTAVTDDFCDSYTWSTSEAQYAAADLGAWETGASAPLPPEPPIATSPIPTMSMYGVAFTILGLLLVAVRYGRRLL